MTRILIEIPGEPLGPEEADELVEVLFESIEPWCEAQPNIEVFVEAGY